MVVENPRDSLLWSFRHLVGSPWNYRTRSPDHVVAVDSVRDSSSVDREHRLVTGNDSGRTDSRGRNLTEFLHWEGWAQEDVVARLEIQAGSPDSSVEAARVALLRLLEASISFLARLMELLEELVSVPPIHGRPLPDCFVKGEGGGRRLRIS